MFRLLTPSPATLAQALIELPHADRLDALLRASEWCWCLFCACPPGSPEGVECGEVHGAIELALAALQ